MAWRRGQIAFENTPLESAIEEVNRYSTHKLMLGDPEVRDILISGLFRTGDAENFALALTKTHPVEVRERDGRLVILRASR